MTNILCATNFIPTLVQSTNICTSGTGTVGACNGDSGGPLALNRSGRNILVRLDKLVSVISSVFIPTKLNILLYSILFTMKYNYIITILKYIIFAKIIDTYIFFGTLSIIHIYYFNEIIVYTYHFSQIGVVSFGSPQGCHANMPSVYARVTSFAEWFRSEM